MENLTRRMSVLSDKTEERSLLMVLTDVYERFRSVCFSSAGLVIKGSASALAKTGSSGTNLVVQGVLRTIAAATDVAVLSGTVTNAAFNVFVFSIDKAGVLYTQMGTEGAALADVRFPAVPATRTTYGYITVNPTGTGNFVGGTTALDDATVAPNVVYVNTIGAFDVNATVI